MNTTKAVGGYMDQAEVEAALAEHLRVKYDLGPGHMVAKFSWYRDGKDSDGAKLRVNIDIAVFDQGKDHAG